MNIVICDDERKIIEDVALICREVFQEAAVIYASQSAENLLKKVLSEECKIDLFILDIEMPGRNGLWFKQKLENYHYGCNILFLTSHDEYIRDAFGKYVIGFVDKVSFYQDKNELIKKLETFKQTEENRELICIKCAEGNINIRKDYVVTVSSKHVYSYVEYITGKVENGVLITGTKLVRKALKEWEKILGNDFLRISKSVIINMEYIEKMDKVVCLKTGKRIEISRTRVNECQDRYFKYCSDKMKWE